MTSNLYKVGDWVYCEVSPFQPYVIRKIEELTKTPCGNVEAKVICAFRHQDIPSATLASIEKYQAKNNPDKASDKSQESNSSSSETNTNSSNQQSATTTTSYDYEESEVSDLNDQQRYNLKHRELFFSKYTDTIAATTIRAKCAVLLFNEEVERYSDYVLKEDSFFYHLTYDPYQKSIYADKGEIRVGFRYQSEIPQLKITPNGTIIEDSGEISNSLHNISVPNDRVLRSQLAKMSNSKEQSKELAPEIPISSQTEEPMNWCPTTSKHNIYVNKLTDHEIEKFLVLAKSVGTFARALDCNSAFKQPSLTLSAASASRDITLFHAMNVLHDNNYDIGKAALSLITQNGPVLCKDEIEDWTASEANLFEDAFEKYGKEFNDIRKDYLPWKSMKSIIEYYYLWKTTDRYVQQKRIKLAEQESKLKQVYIPNHSKQNQSAMIKQSHVQYFNQYDVHLKPSCESCGAPNTSTNQWYAYNPSNLVQLIMSGQVNPNVLANAAAAHISSIVANGNQNNMQNNHVINQARLCSECWTYWKKFGSFKYANARQERLNQIRNQPHKCSVNGCGKEFKQKQLLVKHCGIAHGYFAKTNQPVGQNSPRPAAIRNRTAFYLLTTPMTQAARCVCTNTIKIKKLGRKPFKQVELAELNKEWLKEPRNISLILEEFKKINPKIRKLDVKLINTIFKNRASSLKKSKKSTGKKSKPNGINGESSHPENDEEVVEEDDDSSDAELVIDNDNSNEENKPEFLKYFEKRCSSPCYTPEQLAFPKPSLDQLNKFHNNLITQNRKRPHDQASNGSINNDLKSEFQSTNDLTSPSSKRSNSEHTNGSLKSLNNNKSLNGGISSQEKQVTKQQGQRLPQKSVKPTQSSNLLNAPDDIYYLASANLKTYRREIELSSLRRLARKPNKLLSDQYDSLYKIFDKLLAESIAKQNLLNSAAKNEKSEDKDTDDEPPKKKKLSRNDEDVEEMADDEVVAMNTDSQSETEVNSVKKSNDDNEALKIEDQDKEVRVEEEEETDQEKSDSATASESEKPKETKDDEKKNEAVVVLD